MKKGPYSFKEVLNQKLQSPLEKESAESVCFMNQSYDYQEGPMMTQLYHLLNKKTYSISIKANGTFIKVAQNLKTEAKKELPRSFNYSHLNPELRSALDFFLIYGEIFQDYPSLETIKTSYRRLALKLHPDRHPPTVKDHYSKLFIELRRHYEVLKSQ